MKKSIQAVFLAFVFLTVLLSGCTPASTPVPPTFTPSPIPPTFTPKPTATATAIPTATAVPPTPTPASPYTYVDMGSVFAKDCGDGIPRMLMDWGLNGLALFSHTDGIHGHVDVAPPIGCDVYNFEGEIIAPVPGTITANDNGYYIYLPKYTLIKGIDKVLANVAGGTTAFNPEKIDWIYVAFGHIQLLRSLGKGPTVVQGQPIADIHRSTGDDKTGTKVAVYVFFRYDEKEFTFSPSMFFKETGRPTWPCFDEKYVINLYPKDWPLDLIEPCNPKYDFHN
jgi:hypothetical protein